jgi:hypothetical protein
LDQGYGQGGEINPLPIRFPEEPENGCTLLKPFIIFFGVVFYRAGGLTQGDFPDSFRWLPAEAVPFHGSMVTALKREALRRTAHLQKAEKIYKILTSRSQILSVSLFFLR